MIKIEKTVRMELKLTNEEFDTLDLGFRALVWCYEDGIYNNNGNYVEIPQGVWEHLVEAGKLLHNKEYD